MVPTVVIIGGELRGRPSISRATASALRSATVVLTGESSVVALQSDLAHRARPREVLQLDIGVTLPDGASQEPRRGAARAQLELPAGGGPVLWWVGPNHEVDPAVRDAAAARGWPLLIGGGPDDELVVAASDVAVMSDVYGGGEPHELLRAAFSGHTLVAPVAVTAGRLPPTACIAVPEASIAVRQASATLWDPVLERVEEPRWRTTAAEAAGRAVATRFDLGVNAVHWKELLARVVEP